MRYLLVQHDNVGIQQVNILLTGRYHLAHHVPTYFSHPKQQQIIGGSEKCYSSWSFACLKKFEIAWKAVHQVWPRQERYDIWKQQKEKTDSRPPATSSFIHKAAPTQTTATSRRNDGQPPSPPPPQPFASFIMRMHVCVSGPHKPTRITCKDMHSPANHPSPWYANKGYILIQAHRDT